MQRWNWNDAERFVRRGTRRRIWKRIVSAMACVVVFCTTYALILPAITMEQPTFCGFEEHTHDESCYTRTDIPACTQTEDLVHTHIDSCYAPTEPTSAPVVHTHDDTCYTKTRGELICQTAEFEGHTHGDTCYTPSATPTCGLEEAPGHTHGPECQGETLICGLEEDENHTHGPECATMEITCGQEETPGHTHGPDCCGLDLICQVEEIPGHKHDDNCYAWTKTLSCGLNEGDIVPTETTAPALLCTEPETQPHVHTESCAPTEPTCGQDHTHSFLCGGTWELTCGMEEHTHTLACFSDPEADVEAREVWERLVSAVELTGVWGDDVVAIAKSQLGYHESTRNYAVWEDGSTHGYTRYGDWYGSPYGDWCAMFASFCVHYAGVEGMPLNWGCRTWIADLSQPELDRYRPAEDYTPKPGDLIFFDWEEPDGTSDDLSDHVGIVAELIAATDTEPARVRTIEGNSSNQVKYNEYDQDDTRILGYGVMPENPELAPDTPEDTPLWTYADDTLYVEVRLPADTAVPAEAVLVVTPIPPEDGEYAARLTQARQTVEGLVTGLSLYDISFYTPDGDYLPVSDTAQVTMGFTRSPVDPEAGVRVLHFAGEDGLPQVIEEVTVEEKPLRMRLPEAEPAPMSLARMIEETQPQETQPQQTLPEEPGETVTETRTVVEFTTQGFSTFAVVQVENAYVTTILGDNDVTADNGHPLAGKILAISTRDELNCTKDNSNSHRGLTTKPTMGTNNNAQVTSLPVKNQDGKVTVSRSMFWKFTAVDGAANTYYVRPYDPVTEEESGYLHITGNQSVNVVPGDNAQEAYQILVERQNDGEIRLKHNGRTLSYDRAYDFFTDYGNPDDGNIHRGALVLSEYGDPNGNNQFPVTNLDGQKLAIVSVRASNDDNTTWSTYQAVTSESFTKDNVTRLAPGTLDNPQFQPDHNGLLSITGDLEDNCFWTFKAVDAQNGVYNIVGSNNQYMHIGQKEGTTSDAPQNITVSSYKVGEIEYVTLSVNGAYLNRYTGDSNTEGYVGWDGGDNKENGPTDPGSRFILARREQFTAEVISRAELWSAGRWTGNKLIFFVRQTDDYGTARYYAMKVDGGGEEIFLEPGQTLADGATIYADLANREQFLWDANGSPTDGWNDNNILDGAIDLWPRNGNLVLSPNGDGGQGNVNGAQPDGYTNPQQGKMSITSQLESDNNWGWHILDNGQHEDKKGQPLRAYHNAAFQKVANGAQAGIDDTIASTIISDLRYKEPTHQYCLIRYDGNGFVAENANNFNQKPATESTAFYVAVLNIPEEQIEETHESHDTVVAKVLTRHEYQDAVQIDGNARVILLTKQNGNYYALDYQGNAIALDTLAGDENAVVLPGDETYNTNRILWDALPANVNPETGQFIDMALENEAVEDLYLSPMKNDLREHLVSLGHPTVAEHSTGFYGLSEKGNLIATSEDGTSGTVIKYEGDKYVLETVNQLAGHSDEAHTFYVALVTDRGVRYDATDKTVEEYKVFPAVKENVRMKLFNYGSAIDYLGQTYNNTTYNDGQTENGNKDKDNLIFRFFHRPSFTGQAIDGTNETGSEYATADYFQNNDRNYGETLLDGVPYLKLDSTKATTNREDNIFSLGYLFSETGFKNPNENLTLHQTNGNAWQEIPNNNGTQVNANGTTTAPANTYNPVQNPNYAVQSFSVTNGGEGTGLFRFDYNTGNYYYDSGVNAAWYNPGTQKMELYNYALVPSGSLWCIGGNFLPFNKGHEEGRLVPNDTDWQSKHDFTINPRTYQLNGIHHDNDPVIGRSSMTDLWFGMTLEIDFTMTADGMLVPIDPNGAPLQDREPQDMIFEFSGDDDVLVYVDGVLCLNIGGIHGAEYGDINFHTGIIHKDGRTDDYEQSTLAKRFAAAGKSGEIDENGRLKPWTKHTLQFFYLERGGNISNCRIGYNLADIPVGGMSVTKEVEGIGKDQDYYGTYEFQLTEVTLGPNNTSSGLDLYYVIRKGEDAEEEKHQFTQEDLVANKVTFTLHANETAEFFGFPAGTKLKVKETKKTLGEEIAKVKMVKAGGTGDEEFQQDNEYWVSPEISIDENNMAACKVTCTNQLETVDVDITKALAMLDGTPVTGMDTETFTLKYTITEPGKDTGAEQTLTVTPGKHETLTVPFGSWLDIKEVKAGGYKVEWDYKVKKAEDNAQDAIADKTHVSNDEFEQLPGIHLVGDTEIVCRNLMTFVEVQKTVEGNPTEEKYKFNYTVEYDNQEVGKGSFELAHGDKPYRIDNLRLGSKVTVTEEKGDYLTSYVITDWKPQSTTPEEPTAPATPLDKKEGSAATCENVETPQVIHFTNRPVYELPMTGGVGTQLYTMGGLLLMAAAILLYYQIRRGRGASPSP